MANVTALISNVQVNVSTTTANITVTEADSNTTVSNIIVANTVVAVSTNETNLIVSLGAVTEADIRAAITGNSPINFNQVTGVISIDDAALFSGKTTDNLSEGNTNLYYTNARVNAYVIDAGLDFNAEKVDDRVANLMQTTGNLTFTYNDGANTLTLSQSLQTQDIAEGSNLYFTDARTVSAIQNNAVTLKNYKETIYNHGNVSGTVTLDAALGTVHNMRLVSNVTNVAFANVSAGHGLTVLIQQDDIGNWSWGPSSTTNWDFAGNVSSINTTSNANTLVTIIYDGVNYKSSFVKLDGDIELDLQFNNTDDLAEGTTNLYFTAARARGNVSATDAGGLGSFAYNNSTGVFTYTGPSDSDVRNLLSNTSPITYSSATGIIGLSSTASITTTGNISGGYILGNGSQLTGVTSLTNAQVLAHIATQPLTVGGNLTVNGNINATGNINVQNVEDLYVRDQTIVMNANAASPANVQIVANRPGFANVELKWNEQSDRWTFTNDGTTYFPMPTSTTDLVEGANLYYTTARANTAIGAYQGNINTPGTITAGIANVTTINTTNLTATNLTATNNVFALGALHSPDGSNIQYVRAWNADYELTNTSSNLNILLASENNNRIAYSTNGNLRYVPSTKTLFITDGTIGSNDNNLQGNNLIIGSNISASGNIVGQNITASNSVTATGNITAGYFLGDGSLLTGMYSNTNVQQYLAFGLGSNNITTTTGNIQGAFFKGNGSLLTGMYNNTSVQQYLAFGLDSNNINTNGNITATYFIGNGALLTGIVSGTVTQVNTGENLTGGPITSTGTIGMANTLANVNGVSTQTASNLTLATNKQITVTTRQRNGDVTHSANIRGEGFAVSQTSNFIDAPFFGYSGTEELKTIGINGSITLGSNVITVTSLRDMQNNALNISNVKAYYAFTDQPLLSGGSTLFPAGTYVVSASGSNIFMSANSLYSEPLNFDPSDPYNGSFGALSPGAYDATTGLLVALESNFDDLGANAQLITYNFLNNADLKYGYGPNGPATTNFAYSIGTSSDYSINTSVISNFMFGRTDFSADQTVANFRRGVTIGDADLTNRGENDGVQTFGLNIVWDGTANSLTDYGTSSGIFPQILLKQYTTGTNQATSLTNSGPRMLFIGANGKNTDDPLTTYARNNQELGRISWLSTTSFNATPGTLGPPAYISVVANKDQTNGPGGIGMYLVAAPTDSSLGTVNAVGGVTARQLWAAAHKGNTIISAGAPFNNNSGNVIFAPARQGLAEGNAVLLAQRIVDSACASPHWATIGYDVPTSNTGARISVTNGHNTTAGRNGNLSVALNRRDNGAGFGTKEWALKIRSGQTDLVLTEDGVIRTTFAGANITTAGNITAGYFLGNGSQLTGLTTTQVTEGTNLYYTNALARASISGTGDISYDANTGVISYIGTPGDITDVIAGDGLTGGGTSGNVTLTVGAGTGITVNADNVAVNMGAFTTTNLAEGSNLYYTDTRANSAIDTRVNKAFVEGLGVSYTSLTDKPVIPTHTSNLTNDSGFITTATANVISVNTKTGTVVLNTGDIAESGNLYFSNARARQSISGTGDISYDANTGVISYTGTPGDITDVIAGSGLTGGGSTGNVTLNVGAGTGITVNADNIAVNMSAFSTTDLVEGANLYYTSTRANTAIDTRVNKAFVEALNVSYTSLANTPTNVSAFTNDAGYLVAANLASLTANVNSVNGQTGTVILNTTNIAEGANLYFTNTRVQNYIVDSITTSDIDEGANLYYTTNRANSAIGAYQGSISTTGNIATTGNMNAGYYFGNGSQLTGITSSYGNSNVTTLLANFGSNTISTTGNITAGNTIVNGVSFNTAGTTSPSSGQIVYNSNYGTHQVGLTGSNVMLMGQDLVVYARNDEANTLSKGEVVYISGAQGDKATVRRAKNDSDANSATTIGIVKSNIAAGQLGYIVSQGVVDGINLGAYTEGDKLYLGNVAGTFTNVKPSAPQHIVFIGVVERANAGNGQILVRVQNGFELDEIHDVQLTSVAANDILIRNSGNTLWINQNFNSTANSAIAAYQGNINTAGTLRANSVTVHGTTNVSLQVYDNTLGTSSGGMYFNVGGVTDVNAGFGVLRPVAGAPTFLVWNEATDNWQFTNDGSTFYNMATSTTDLAEGTNLYYTNARANTNSNAWLTTKTTTDLVEGANLYFSNARVATAVQTSNITLKQFQETRVNLGTTNGNITLDMANGSIFAMTANGNISNIALSNAGVGASGTLIITQDGTGSRLLTVTGAWKFAGASKTLSTAANTIDIVNFFTDGTTVYAALSKGYA